MPKIFGGGFESNIDPKESDILNTKIDEVSESREFISQTFTFVYRGDNPYLNELSSQMQALGHNVIIHKVPVETPEDVLNDSDKLKEIIGSLEGKVVTDKTLYETMSTISGEEVVNAYSLLEWEVNRVEDVITKVGPIIEEIRSKGKSPVVLRQWLGDHMGSVMGHSVDKIESELSDSSELIDLKKGWYPNEAKHPRSYVDSANLYASVLSEKFNVPVIKAEHFNNGVGQSNIVSALENMGISAEEAVIMVDHHVYRIRDEEVKETGFDKVQIVPICPCCIGFKEGSKKGLREFNVFSLDYKEAVSFDIKKLTGEFQAEDPQQVEDIEAADVATKIVPVEEAVNKVTTPETAESARKFEDLSFKERAEEIMKRKIEFIGKPKGAPWWTEAKIDQKIVDENTGVAAFIVAHYGNYHPKDGPEVIYSVFIYRDGDDKAINVYNDGAYGNVRNAKVFIDGLEGNQVSIRGYDDKEQRTIAF